MRSLNLNLSLGHFSTFPGVLVCESKSESESESESESGDI